MAVGNICMELRCHHPIASKLSLHGEGYLVAPDSPLFYPDMINKRVWPKQTRKFAYTSCNTFAPVAQI